MDLRKHQSKAGRGNAGKQKTPEHRLKLVAALKRANAARELARRAKARKENMP